MRKIRFELGFEQYVKMVKKKKKDQQGSRGRKLQGVGRFWDPREQQG